MTFPRPRWDDLSGFLDGPNWKVIHGDGRGERFDGQKLVGSLVQAGVPVFEAMQFYSEFLERAPGRVRNDAIRLSEVTDLVATLLMESGESRRASWLRDYDNLYGIESEFPVEAFEEPGFIDPGDAGRLARELRSLVRAQITSDHELPGAVSRQAMDEVVDRLVMIVRLCGFRRIPRGFLEELVVTLAEHSSSLAFPGTRANEADRERTLQAADDLVGAATLRANSAAHRDGVSTMLILATAPAATVFLQYYGFMPRVGPGAVLRQMHGALEAGAGRFGKADSERAQNAATAAFQQLEHRLSGFGLRANDLLVANGELVGALGLDESTAAIPSDVRSVSATDGSGDFELLMVARRFLDLVRIATDAAPGLRDVRDALNRTPLDPLLAQDALLSNLRAQGLNCTGPFQAGRAIVTVRTNVRSKLGEHAQEVAILVTDSAVAEIEADIRSLTDFVRESESRVGFLVCRALDPVEGRPSPNLPKEYFERLSLLAGKGTVVVPVGTRRLLRALSSGSALFDTLAEAIEGTYPGLRSVGWVR